LICPLLQHDSFHGYQMFPTFTAGFLAPATLAALLDLTQIDREMMTFDVSGHYARPDFFRFEKKFQRRAGQSQSDYF